MKTAARPRGPAGTGAAKAREPARAARPHAAAREAIGIPRGTADVDLEVGDRVVHLTNLEKPFWPELGLTKRDLLGYYATVAPWLVPHLAERAMVMKRYPNGAAGPFFFMKRAPSPRPEWIRTCSIEHASGSVIDFPIVEDLASLLWVVNLGCIDLNPWYARCDDTDRPDFLHFDLDPTPGATFAQVLETARLVHTALTGLGMKAFAKSTGSKGVHVYVPIVRGPVQKDVWGFAKRFAQALATQRPDLVTAEYRVAKRPPAHVLVDYNQNAWGRTLASVYSVRPQPRATVSTPVTWEEVERGFDLDEHRIDTVPARLAATGDLWAPLLAPRGRVDLGRFL